MGLKFEKEEHNNNNISTPKLSLYNTFPSKRREPIGMLTPPMQSFASIPFEWEEAPGKPRRTTADAAGAFTTTGRSSALPKSKTVRCLVPPPRLMNIGTSKVTNVPSPTDEPYCIGRSLSFSGGRSLRSPERQGGCSRERLSSSSSWSRGGCSMESRDTGFEGIMDFSSVVENTQGELKSTTTKRMRRRSKSFLIVSSASSKVLVCTLFIV